jgi:hypothetical protein
LDAPVGGGEHRDRAAVTILIQNWLIQINTAYPITPFDGFGVELGAQFRQRVEGDRPIASYAGLAGAGEE